MKDYEFLISVNELRDNILLPGWRVVDCRFNLLKPEQGFADYLAGHIPLAQYANLDRDLAAPVTATSGRHPLPGPDTLALTLGWLGIGNDTQVVVYDEAGGAIAARLWWLLKWLGHSRVALLDGGFNAWLQSESIEQEQQAVAKETFLARPNNNLVVTTSSLTALLSKSDSVTLVDARDRARFAGEVEPIDSVAGHVPGAMNFPFAESLNSDGTWLEPDQLREKWSLVGACVDDSGWIAMCGSGVTACHLAISAQLAGFAAPSLYVGSWSEWIRDPARPVANGPC